MIAHRDGNPEVNLTPNKTGNTPTLTRASQVIQEFCGKIEGAMSCDFAVKIQARFDFMPFESLSVFAPELRGQSAVQRKIQRFFQSSKIPRRSVVIGQSSVSFEIMEFQSDAKAAHTKVLVPYIKVTREANNLIFSGPQMNSFKQGKPFAVSSLRAALLFSHDPVVIEKVEAALDVQLMRPLSLDKAAFNPSLRERFR